MNEFFSMGGYAAYVWPSYGLSALVMVVILIVSLRQLRATEAEFKRLKAATAPSERKQQTETPNGDEA